MFRNYNPLTRLKTSPEYTRARVYEKCVLKENQIIFNRLTMMRVHTQLNYKRKLQVNQAVVV